MSAKYTKLKDGTWGLRVEGRALAGSSIMVHKSNGEIKSETVGRVLWSGKDSKGNEASLCTIGKRNYSTRGYCAECGEKIVSANQRCWETGSTCYSD